MRNREVKATPFSRDPLGERGQRRPRGPLRPARVVEAARGAVGPALPVVAVVAAGELPEGPAALAVALELGPGRGLPEPARLAPLPIDAQPAPTLPVKPRCNAEQL